METDPGGRSGTCFCGNHIPILGNVVWCDSCIEEFLQQNIFTIDTFIAQKKEARRQREQATPPDGSPAVADKE